MDIGGILGTIFSGGVTGIIGSIANAVASYKLKKLEYQHEEVMAKERRVLLQMQTNRDVQLGEITKEQLETETAAAVQKASYDQDKSTYVNRIDFSKFGVLGKFFGSLIGFLLGIVDFLRGIIRPGSTIYFEVFMFIMWFSVYKLLGGYKELPKEQLLSLFETLCMLILYCGTTCVLWWFGGRQLDKYFQNKLMK